MQATAAQPPAIGLLLAGSLCLLPFLVPYHQPPVLSFHAEWLAAALGTAAALAALTGRSLAIVRLPVPAWWLVAFALFLAVRAASGDQAYPQLPLLAALYVFYAVLMMWLGAQLASALGIERVAVVLAVFLLAGALANAPAGVIQFYGRPALLDDFVAELRGNRAYGNIAQANLYANYLALGESALLFLWVRARVRTAYALPALALLVLGSALSGSRGVLLYALWFAALGALAQRVQAGAEARRWKFAAYGVAGALLAAYIAVPWLNQALQLGPMGVGAFDRLLASSGDAEPRWQAWLLALHLFTGSPLAGVGIGEFAGAAFELGLDPSLANIGGVWTSPHNLPVQLLAETGAVGAALALGALCIWGWQAARRYRVDPQRALWWVITASGIGMLHSLIEFPMWSAHFLGVTALLMGAGATWEARPPERSRSSRILAITFKDYIRLDTTRITGTTSTLARAADAQRDAATMHDLARGLLAPSAEVWIVMGAPLDRGDLAAKLAMSKRVARHWPSHDVVVRRAVFLALDGEAATARALLARALQTYPRQRDSTLLILEQALPADPTAIQPLLVSAKSAGTPATSSRE